VAFRRKLNSTIEYRYTLTCTNAHLWTEIQEVRSSDAHEWSIDRVDFHRYSLLRINGDFLIAALVHNGDADIESFIIPTRKGGIVLGANSEFRSEYRNRSVPSPDHQFQSGKYYRIKEIDGRFALYDNLFRKQLLEQVYDSITMSGMIVIGRLQDRVDLYNVLLDPIEIREPLAAIDIDLKVQILTPRGILWYTPDGIIHDTMPIIIHGVCGNYSSVERNITNKNGIFYETSQLSYSGFYNSTDSIAIPLREYIIALSYLTGSDKHSNSEYSHLGTVYSIPYNYYFFETSVSKGILKITSNADSIRRAIPFPA
jgi:hypothetical protein